MSSNSLFNLLLSQPLHVLVTLIGVGAVGAGSFSLVAPNLALQVYGISTTSTPGKHNSHPPSSTDYEPISRSLSIRNLTLGLSILAITTYWINIVDQDQAAARSIRTCLGYIITIGSLVPLTDAYGAWTDGSESLRGRATALHCFRSCAWIIGGLWCLMS